MVMREMTVASCNIHVCVAVVYLLPLGPAGALPLRHLPPGLRSRVTSAYVGVGSPSSRFRSAARWSSESEESSEGAVEVERSLKYGGGWECVVVCTTSCGSSTSMWVSEISVGLRVGPGEVGGRERLRVWRPARAPRAASACVSK